jgi:hypothetical protein
MLRAHDRGFDTIHIDLAPLNLDVLLPGCVRRIEGGRSWRSGNGLHMFS